MSASGSVTAGLGCGNGSPRARFVSAISTRALVNILRRASSRSLPKLIVPGKSRTSACTPSFKTCTSPCRSTCHASRIGCFQAILTANGGTGQPLATELPWCSIQRLSGVQGPLARCTMQVSGQFCYLPPHAAEREPR